MKAIVFLALWLQMSGVGEIKFTPQNQYVQFPADTGYIRCPANPGTLPLACKTSDGKEVTVGIVPGAADETDGKPPVSGDLTVAQPKCIQRPAADGCNTETVCDGVATSVTLVACMKSPYHLTTEVAAEPVDVPAVQVDYVAHKKGEFFSCGLNLCSAEKDIIEKRYTCDPKSRILEHDENSPPKYWCRKVEF